MIYNTYYGTRQLKIIFTGALCIGVMITIPKNFDWPKKLNISRKIKFFCEEFFLPLMKVPYMKLEKGNK